MAEIAIRAATKAYDGGVLAVDAIDLDVADGELLVLVGPSGCGKSTLLRMVAGLEEMTAGSVHIGGRDVTELAPKDRDVAMVFQSYALYPHMTVRRNIGYPLRLAKVAKPELERRVAEVASLLQLDEVLDRRPSQLSGGQRQRVAMGRALVREPQAFLMDEPLSNLDAKLRVEMRAEIARLQRTLGVTTLYVTHDQVEAMTMGTRVAVLDKGRLQQVDTPQRIYDAPRNLFVATFMGSPAMNLLPGRVIRAGEGDADLVIDLGAQRLPVDAALAEAHPGLAERVGRRVIVGVRPEALDDAGLEPGTPGDRVLEATVDLVESLGAELMVHVALTGLPTTPGPLFAPDATAASGTDPASSAAAAAASAPDALETAGPGAPTVAAGTGVSPTTHGADGMAEVAEAVGHDDPAASAGADAASATVAAVGTTGVPETAGYGDSVAPTGAVAGGPTEVAETAASAGADAASATVAAVSTTGVPETAGYGDSVAPTGAVAGGPTGVAETAGQGEAPAPGGAVTAADRLGEPVPDLGVASGIDGPGGPAAPGGEADEVAPHWDAVVARGGRAVARLSTRSRVRPGDAVKLAVDPTGIHFFDSTSGVSLRTTGT